MKTKVFTDYELSVLFKELSLLLHSGVSVGDGLLVMAEGEKEPLKSTLISISQDILSGTPVFKAFDNSALFNSHVVGMINVGEKTGSLEKCLSSLSAYYQKKDIMDTSVKNALVYPVFLLFLMVFILSVLIIKVLPIFESVYISLGSRLTGFAAILLELGIIINRFLPVIIVLFVISFILLIMYLYNLNIQKKVNNIFAIVSKNSNITKKINNSFFAYALYVSLSSGLNIDESLELSAKLMRDNNASYKRYQSCISDIKNGVSISSAMSRYEILPSYASRMLEIGIKSGNSDSVMEEVADRLNYEAMLSIEEHVGKIEPLIVLSCSIMVGIILLCVMIPLINIMSVIG